MGFALWLVPRSDALNRALQSQIAQLRAANPDCSGEFGLHATLLAGLGDRSIDPSALLDVAQKVVAQWHTNHTQLQVGLKNVETRGSYFQCIVVSLIRDSALLELYTAAKDAVDSAFPAPPSAQQRPDYFPHISLIYAPLTATQAQSQIDDMHERGVFNHTDHGIAFQGHNNVHFASLDIVDCTGKPQDWRTLHSIPL